MILLHVEAGRAWKLQKGELGSFDSQRGVRGFGNVRGI